MGIRGFVSSLLQSGNGKTGRQTGKKNWAKELDWIGWSNRSWEPNNGSHMHMVGLLLGYGEWLRTKESDRESPNCSAERGPRADAFGEFLPNHMPAEWSHIKSTWAGRHWADQGGCRWSRIPADWDK